MLSCVYVFAQKARQNPQNRPVEHIAMDELHTFYLRFKGCGILLWIDGIRFTEVLFVCKRPAPYTSGHERQ